MEVSALGARLMPATASTATIKEQTWLRCVAANPAVEIDDQQPDEWMGHEIADAVEIEIASIVGQFDGAVTGKLQETRQPAAMGDIDGGETPVRRRCRG